MGNFKFVKDQLKLGDLSGNRFTVVMRNISDVNEQQINEIVQQVAKDGFINYFGLQRFGKNIDIPTHKIGIAVLQEKWEEAVRLILLSQTEGGSDNILFILNFLADKKVRESIEKFLDGSEKNIQKVLSNIPRYMSIERTILNAYDKFGTTEHQKAFQSVS